MAPTAQAQRAINQMLQAGFKRTEFSVRTARHYVGKVNGKRCYEYGNASITVKMKSRDMVKYIRPAIKAGLGVIAYRARKGLYLITFTTKFCGLHVHDPGYRDPVTLSNRRVHKRPRPDRDARPPTYLVTYTQRITGSYEHKILIGAWNEAEAIENFYRGQVKRYGEDHQTTALSAERFEVK